MIVFTMAKRKASEVCWTHDAKRARVDGGGDQQAHHIFDPAVGNVLLNEAYNAPITYTPTAMSTPSISTAIGTPSSSAAIGSPSFSTAIDTPHTPTSPPAQPKKRAQPRPKFPCDEKTKRCTFPGCDKAFNRESKLEAHQRSHTKERPFKCGYDGCTKAYITNTHLQDHIKTHTGERAYACIHPGCGKDFATATRLNRHQLTHEKEHTCRDYPPCNAEFRKKETLEQHIRTQHLGLAAFPCNAVTPGTGMVCNRAFHDARQLKQHQEKEHADFIDQEEHAKTGHWCDVCSPRVGFKTSGLLEAHMKQNHPSCMFCGVLCDGTAGLEQHVQSEHSEPKSLEERKNVACTWEGCDKKFTRVSNLKIHIRSAHEGERFICGAPDTEHWPQVLGCGESFTTKAALNNHFLYVHMGHKRPEPPLNQPHQHPSSTPNLLNQLAGPERHARQTVRCPHPGCPRKFFGNGDVEDHLSFAHGTTLANMPGHQAPILDIADVQSVAQRPVQPMNPRPLNLERSAAQGIVQGDVQEAA
ncbi:hypothetical protein GGR54DRAFT_169678 [Hypoxylon sp. NC1633]|nr:hypothetical protein GGR54DRAFT_169678 [Hypoxylon sp. NC1633]